MIEDKKEKDKDQLVVNAQINLKNIDMKNTKFHTGYSLYKR